MIKRPFGIIALTLLFGIGTVASFISSISLTFPRSFLEPIWRLNPHAREGFDRMGHSSIVLMTVVCVACACTANGLWRLRRWGYWLAVSMLILNLVDDVINVLSGTEPMAIVGIPIVLLLLAYLMRKRTRDYLKLSTSSVNAKGHDGNEANFEGIALSEILKLAGVEFGEHLRGKALANYLLVEATDGYRAVFALPELDPAFNERVIILADHRDGSPLTARDGPWQIVAPGEKRQARWVRQVVALTIRSSEIGSPTKDSPPKVKE